VGLPYQTFINLKLRELIGGSKNSKNQELVDEVRDAILKDLSSGDRLKELVEPLVKRAIKKGNRAA
jgi:hypothetical protein